MREKKLFTFYMPADDTPVQKLQFKDQLLLLARMIFKSSEKDNEQEVENYLSTLTVNCTVFLEKVTEKMRTGEVLKRQVKMSSKFKPVIEDVLNSAAFSNFKYTITEPEYNYNLDYYFLLLLEVK